ALPRRRPARLVNAGYDTMTTDSSAPDNMTWQHALDAQLVQRLARPLVQPGVIDRRLGPSLARRATAARARLPLLADLARRRGSAEDERVAQRPIVYALRRAEPAPIDGEPPDAPRSAATITRP